MKWVIVVLCMFLLEEIAELLYKRTNVYKISLGGCEHFYNVPNDLDIVNTGSGPGLYAISYNECKLKGFNFATAPQNYKYAFRLLKRFQNHIKPGAIVIIVIMSPLSFADNKDYLRPDYSDRFYGILPKEDIDGYSIKRLWISSHPLSTRVIRKIKSLFLEPSETTANNTEEPGVVRIWKHEFNLGNLLDSEQASFHEEAFKNKINILQNGINFCRSKHWMPVFVIPPVPEKTRKYVGADFLDAFVYKNLELLMNNNPDIKLFDYYDDDRFKELDFKNDIFMNEQGRKKFSQILFSEIM